MQFLGFSYDDLTYFCIALFVVCFLQSVVLVWIFFRKRAKSKREKYEQAGRELKFTLPDRENSFVRDRLQGALRPESEAPKERPTPLAELDLRLDHTRKTISKLKASPLTPAERLEVNRISKTLTFFALKNALSPSETRSLNDCFSRLLKLSAKYAL